MRGGGVGVGVGMLGWGWGWSFVGDTHLCFQVGEGVLVWGACVSAMYSMFNIMIHKRQHVVVIIVVVITITYHGVHETSYHTITYTHTLTHTLTNAQTHSHTLNVLPLTMLDSVMLYTRLK